MKNEFEDYLQKEFISSNEYGGIPITKDNCEDLFEQYLENMSTDLLLAYADRFGAACKLEAVKEFGKKLNL